MTHKKAIIRTLILAGMTSILVLPTLLMTPEAIFANNKRKQQPPSWQAVLSSIFRRKEDKPTSRGDLCLITPVNQKPIYSNRPLFLWKGNLTKIAVASRNSDNPFWENPISGGKTFVSYAGNDKLESGQSYEWHGYRKNPVMFAQFEVMDAQKRQVVSDALKALEGKLQTKGLNKEAIALHKVQYFIDQELWSDAIQEAYSVPNPSTELSQMLRDLPETLCKDEQIKEEQGTGNRKQTGLGR
jgi:hypothetical protein